MGMLMHRHNVVVAPVSVDNKPVEIASKPVEIVENVEAENDNDKTFTKTDINRMSKDDLVALAIENGLDSDASGSKLKEMLIEKLGL